MLSSPFVLSSALLLSLALLFLFAPHIFIPPKQTAKRGSFPDELDDLALFRKATSKSSRPIFSLSKFQITNPKPKIAFLFLTNSDLSFAALWERFFLGNQLLFNIYIHADPSVEISPPGGVFDGRFIPAKKTERATATLISAERRLLANALLDDPSNLYFALMSQRCIPLHSFDFVYNSLFGNSLDLLQSSNYKSFIEIVSDDPNLPNRYTARGEAVMVPEVLFEQFRVGSQFFVLNRKHALLVVRERKLWKKFKLPCVDSYSCYPEEHYFPTLLSMVDPQGCSHYTLTKVNWTDSVDGHPHTYLPEEVSPELIQKLRQSDFNYSYLFARKFSPECVHPLMEIADKVIFRD